MDLPDPETLLADPAGAELPERGDLRQAVLDGVVDAVRRRPERARRDAAWALLVRAMETGAPDVVVVPATTLASLHREDWDVPAAIERLAGAVSLSRRADEPPAGPPGPPGPADDGGRARRAGPRQALRRPAARGPLEVAAICRAVGGRRDLASVLSCDAAAQTVQPLCRTEGIELVGGDGTDLRTGFTRALRTRPDVVVVLTDGQTPWPGTRPACRTVVGLFPRTGGAYDENDPAYRPDVPPAWARVVTIGSAAG